MFKTDNCIYGNVSSFSEIPVKFHFNFSLNKISGCKHVYLASDCGITKRCWHLCKKKPLRGLTL